MGLTLMTRKKYEVDVSCFPFHLESIEQDFKEDFEDSTSSGKVYI